MRWELKELKEPLSNDGWKRHFALLPVRLQNTQTVVWFEWVERSTETEYHEMGSDTYTYYRDVQRDSPWFKPKKYM